MLFFFFLRRLFKQFFLVFFILIIILGASNLILRVEIISTLNAVMQIFFVMLPLMTVYAIPISSGMAVQMEVGQLLVGDELLLLRFFKSAYKSLCRSVLVFSLILTLFYIPLIFEFAPQSYLLGKKILLDLAKKQFCNLEPQKFHSPYPGFTFFFKDKKYEPDSSPRFETIFLAFHNKLNERYIFTAQEGFFKNDSVFLINGSVYTISSDKRYSATFKESNINIDKLFNLENSKSLNLLKFWKIKQLIKRLRQDKDVLWEFFKRIAQILWAFLFPFLSLFFILRFGRNKSNLLFTVASNGLIFLFSYISIAIAQALTTYFTLSMISLFGPLICVIILLYVFYGS